MLFYIAVEPRNKAKTTFLKDFKSFYKKFVKVC